MFLAFKDPNGAQVTTRDTGIINRKRMSTQKPHRVLKFQQTSVSVTYIYMHFFDTACLPNHHHNGLMTIGALGHTHIRLHVAGIQESKDCPKYQYNYKHNR